MHRDLSRLIEPRHDLVIVGGGIHGACAAWDATLRGLKVALVERDDFGAATSAKSLRIVHGGLRALARGDLRRARESVRERSALLRIAPALVEPLPVVIPTTGWGAHGRPALLAALALNDLLSLDRNRGVTPDHQLPRGRILSRQECRRLFSGFPAEATGGALWWDARLRDPERLTLAFVRAAADRGAAVANYCRADELLVDGDSVIGVRVSDMLAGAALEIRARRVVIAAGPWTGALCGDPLGSRPQAFALNVEIGTRLAEAAVGLRSPAGRDADPIIGGRRFIFLVPQPSSTLLGTWYGPWRGGDPEPLVRRGAAALLAEFNAACPSLRLSEGDLVGCHWGLLPLKAGREPGRPQELADGPRVIDHGGARGRRGMLSAEGVKYTTARGVAQDVIDRVVSSLGLDPVPCRTAEVRIDRPSDAGNNPLDAQIQQAVREEMAVRLSDVIRRTSLSAGPPASREGVAAIARIAAPDLGWSPAQVEAEIDDVTRRLLPLGSTADPAG
jgi:glycerol-3-phosphate dehydrogenase